MKTYMFAERHNIWCSLSANTLTPKQAWHPLIFGDGLDMVNKSTPNTGAFWAVENAWGCDAVRILWNSKHACSGLPVWDAQGSFRVEAKLTNHVSSFRCRPTGFLQENHPPQAGIWKVRAALQDPEEEPKQVPILPLPEVPVRGHVPQW